MKRKDGQDYEPLSTRGLFSSFNQYLKEYKYSASIIEDIVYDQARKCLEARSKLLKKEGKGKKPNAAEALMHAVWLFNSMHFSLRGYEEHGRMTWGNVQLHLAVDGTEYLEYCKHQMKTRTGAEPRNVRAVKPKAFSTPNGPPERDPVAVYKICSQKRPDPPYYRNKLHKKSFIE